VSRKGSHTYPALSVIADQPRDAGTNISERRAQDLRQGIDETKIPRIDGTKIAIPKSRWYPDVVE
jgi:hypothetical protein